jgi:hypothetical protein
LEEQGTSEEPNRAAVDGDGRALLISAGDHGLREVVVAPGGRAGSPRRILTHAVDYPVVSANALGATSILVGEGKSEESGGSLEVVLGNTSGENRPPETIPLLRKTWDREHLTIVNPDGIATVIWVVEPEWSQTPRESEEETIDALTIAPGAQTGQIGRGEPIP